MLAGKGLDPLAVLDGALAQDLLGDGTDAMHVAEEVHDVLRASEQWQVAEDDDAVETVIYECQQPPNSRAKSSIGPLPPLRLTWHQEHRTEDRWKSKKFQIFFG